MREGSSGGDAGTGSSRPIRRLLFAVVLAAVAALVIAAAFSLGTGHARRVLAGGFFNTVGRDVTVGIGVLVTVLLGVLAVARRRRWPRAGALVAVALAASWIGWAAGYAAGTSEGPAVEYAGSARISAGSRALGSVPIGCSSVVGDPALLAGFAVQTNGFQVNLRDGLDRTMHPGIYGEAILPGATVSFGNSSHGADASGFVPIDEVVVDGLDGRATVPAVIIAGTPASGSDADVEIEWTCDPATMSIQ